MLAVGKKQGVTCELEVDSLTNADAFFTRLAHEKRQPRATVHSLHRYFGKLVPAIPRAAIHAFTQPGDTVGDAFAGSGTTAVETRLSARHGWARDLNPLAVSVTRAKVDDLDAQELQQLFSGLEHQLAASSGEQAVEVPYCTNMEHWFRPDVVRELACIKSLLVPWPPTAARNFFLVCLSAIIREVSNADPRHVFPGYSKRMRAWDGQGRDINVRESYLRGTQRRIRHYARYRSEWPQGLSMDVGVGNSCQTALPSCHLLVTNPPYLGSIRYLETMKLEMFWLSWLTDSTDYRTLDRQLLASERWYQREYQQPLVTGVAELDSIIARLHQSGHGKMGYTTARYFLMVDDFLGSAARALYPGGHLVVKISDSYVRLMTIPAHRLWMELATKHQLETVACQTDDYGSRSLLTKRNSFSRMLPHDYLLVFRRA